MPPKQTLGRGLKSLIPLKKTKNPLQESPSPVQKILEIPPLRIKSNPLQPREDFEPQALEELTGSIRQHGILQPIIVNLDSQGNYELVVGERRLRAARILGLKTVPAIVRSAQEQEKLELSLIENIQRKDLNPIEEARAFLRLSEEFGLTQTEIAKKLGKSKPVISNTIRLLNLPSPVQEALIEGKVNKGHARAMINLGQEEEQLQFLGKILKERLTVREVEEATRRSLEKKHPQKMRKRNLDLEDKEKKLGEFLGTRVSIQQREGRGKIVIDFYSEEELREIVKKIIK